jgi:hypothetical protein
VCYKPMDTLSWNAERRQSLNPICDDLPDGPARSAGPSGRRPKGSLVSCAYGLAVTLELFPDAVLKQQSQFIKGKAGGGAKRGKIEGFSAHSASRLREFLTTQHVPGREPWAVTLTMRRLVDPETWRRLWKRFRHRANRLDTAAVYRVELQRRRAPHIHVVAWFTTWKHEQDRQLRLELSDRQLRQSELWRSGWLDCITVPQRDGRIVYDRAEYRYASAIRKVQDNGWAVYQALHSGKGKKEQLGWIGKQWGVIGRHLFVRRKPVELQLSLRQYWTFRRIIRRLLVARGAKRCSLPGHGKWLRCLEFDVVHRVTTWCQALHPRGPNPELHPRGPSPELQPPGPSPELHPRGPSPELQPPGPSPELQPRGPNPELQPRGPRAYEQPGV